MLWRVVARVFGNVISWARIFFLLFCFFRLFSLYFVVVVASFCSRKHHRWDICLACCAPTARGNHEMRLECTFMCQSVRASHPHQRKAHKTPSVVCVYVCMSMCSVACVCVYGMSGTSPKKLVKTCLCVSSVVEAWHNGCTTAKWLSNETLRFDFDWRLVDFRLFNVNYSTTGAHTDASIANTHTHQIDNGVLSIEIENENLRRHSPNNSAGNVQTLSIRNG